LAGSLVSIATMPSLPKLQLIVALAAATALLVPAAAQATLAYVKNPMHPVVFAAGNDGSRAVKLGQGNSPRVSPDGTAVAFQSEAAGGKRVLKLAAAGGGGSRTVLTGLQDGFYVTFSPDSRLIAALRGPELGKRKLVLIDVTSGTLLRTLASGYFSGVSFSPDSTEVAYSVAASETYPPRSDVFRAAIAGGAPVRLTSDHASLDPLWGPNDQIVFARQLGAGNRRYGPKNELFLMNPQGKQVKRLTHTKVGPLLQGLYPTAWSDSGNQLLAEFEGQDTSYAVAVSPKTGAQKALDKQGDGERGFVGTAISNDGTTVLGFTGGFEPGPGHDVAKIPYAGGKARSLVPNAFEPDWSR
jgi:hypothetical protein